jgi:hypothetical protein
MLLQEGNSLKEASELSGVTQNTAKSLLTVWGLFLYPQTLIPTMDSDYTDHRRQARVRDAVLVLFVQRQVDWIVAAATASTMCGPFSWTDRISNIAMALWCFPGKPREM